MKNLDRSLIETEILRWALTNRICKITEVPHWVIMSLLEDIVHTGGHLVEQLVMAIDDSQGMIMEEDQVERAVEQLMTKVLLASLHDDGHIEISSGLANDSYFFDFQQQMDVQITVTPTGEQAQIWEELHWFGSVSQAVLQ
jgi:hypothetical protein